MPTTKEKIRKFLTNDLGLNVEAIGDDEALFTSGLIDSFALIELLSFLESELNYKIDLAELSIDELDTINALAKLVE